MKRILPFLLAILIIGLLSACEEERSFSIDQVKIDAEIQDNGIIRVRELYTYTFDGTYEGMTRSIYSDMKGFKAYETKETSPTADISHMKPLKVEKDEEDDQLLKVYTASENETKSVLYSYEVHGSVNKYADIADMTYAFFDESNETDLNNVDINIHLPDKAPQKDFHVFLHSDVQGELIQTDDKVHYKAQVLKEGETSEMRLVFPTELLSQVDLTKNENKGKEILAKERELASKRANLDEKTANILPWIGLAAGIMIVGGIFLLITHPNRYHGDKSPDHLCRLVESTDPLFLKYLDLNENLNKESFIAGLLSLKQRGIITLEEVPSLYNENDEKDNTEQGNTTLRFTYINEKAELDQADDYLIEWLFTEKDKQGRYFLLDSLIVQDDESESVKEQKAEKFEKHSTQWADLVGKREEYQDLRQPFDAYGIFSTLAVLASFGFIYYFTKVDLLTSAEQVVMPAIVGVFTLGVIFFNKNKWVISAYYLASLIITLLLFSVTDGLILLIVFLLVSWLILMMIPSYVWHEDIKKLKKAINVAYHEFKTKRYPIGTDPKTVERRLEYAIVLGAGKEYGEECGKQEEVEQWDIAIASSYPLLNNPVGVTLMFDPSSSLILYSSMSGSSSSFSGSSSSSSSGGGGAGAF